MKYELKSAGTVRELKEMLDRVQEQHLDLPLVFLFVHGRKFADLQHVGRAAIAEDVIPGDKGVFVEPSLEQPSRTVILLAPDAAAQTAFENDQRSHRSTIEFGVAGASS